jgi:hypothetical protein
VGNVDASGSGIVGGHVDITATGNINGVVVASLGANVNAGLNVNATVLSQGAATVTAGGTVGGTIIGTGNLTVSGGDITATIMSVGPSSVVGSVTPTAPVAAPPGNSNIEPQQELNPTQSNPEVADNGTGDDNDPRKQKKKPQLMEYVGRVTVLLPE